MTHVLTRCLVRHLCVKNFRHNEYDVAVMTPDPDDAKKMTRLTARLLLFAGLTVAAAGCSTDQPPAPTKQQPTSTRSAPARTLPARRAPPPASEPAAPNDPRTDKLRGELDKVRQAIAAKGDEKFAAGPVSPKHSDAWPLDALRRMHRRELRAQLGPPRTCDERMITPCKSADDWVYAFYYVPNWGGGPELLLQFDYNDRCTLASWAFTR